jgi:hypothetical protein
MFMLRVMTWISLRLGRRAGRVVLHLIAAYFLLFAPASRRASGNYLRRALGRPPHWRDLPGICSPCRHPSMTVSLSTAASELFDFEAHARIRCAACLPAAKACS